jgi:hypothetical protein
MAGGLERRNERSGILLALIALAMLTRALVPAGWMPAGDGTALLTLCNGGTISVAQARAAMGGDEHAPATPVVDQPCAFAGVPAIDAPPPLAAPPRPIAVARAEPSTRLRDVGVGRGLVAPPPPSTGPPILA